MSSFLFIQNITLNIQLYWLNKFIGWLVLGVDQEGGGAQSHSFLPKIPKKSPKLAKQVLGASPRTHCNPSFLKSWIRHIVLYIG